MAESRRKIWRRIMLAAMVILIIGAGLVLYNLKAINTYKFKRTRRLTSEQLRHYQRTDNPAARLRFEFLEEQSFGEPARSQVLFLALQSVKTQRLNTRAGFTAGIPTGGAVNLKNLFAPTAGLAPDHTGWVALGPTTIGGRTRSIVIDPQNPRNIWIASVGGGLWRSQDGGKTFKVVNDLMANLAVSWLAMSPKNQNVIYAGTGEGFSLDGIRGAGIFRTLDAEKWTQLPSTMDDRFRVINRIAISADGATILVATPGGVYRNLTATADKPNWQLVLRGSISQVAFDPNDRGRAVAGGFNYDFQKGPAEVGSFFSLDGGKTWTPSTHKERWMSRVELAYAAADSSVVYASVDNHGGEIWYSEDGGRSFSKRKSIDQAGRVTNFLGDPKNSDQGWYDNAIWAGDPNDKTFLVVGGIDVWRSTDGGDTLTHISNWGTNLPHGDQHAIVAHPLYGKSSDPKVSNVVFITNDGGLYRADDIRTASQSQGWTALNQGYSVTQFYSGSGNPATQIIIGGSQDNGTLRYDPKFLPDHWTVMSGGDGGMTASDHHDNDYFYGEYINLSIFRSSDGGRKSEYINGIYQESEDMGYWKTEPYLITDSKSPGDSLFIAPFVLDPNDNNRILAGGRSLWRSKDIRTKTSPDNPFESGPTWQVIKDPTGNQNEHLISAIAMISDDPELIWTCHSNGDIFKTTAGRAEKPDWIEVSRTGAAALPRRYCSHITIDPADHNNVYVTFTGYQKGNLWRTKDGGTNWEDISASLPAVPIRDLTTHPRNSNYLYLATEVGIYASEDQGVTWGIGNEGPTNCSVNQMFWMGNTLVAATHGRGMFSIDLSRIP